MMRAGVEMTPELKAALAQAGFIVTETSSNWTAYKKQPAAEAVAGGPFDLYISRVWGRHTVQVFGGRGKVTRLQANVPPPGDDLAGWIAGVEATIIKEWRMLLEEAGGERRKTKR